MAPLTWPSFLHCNHKGATFRLSGSLEGTTLSVTYSSADHSGWDREWPSLGHVCYSLGCVWLFVTLWTINLPDSSIDGSLQARILGWVAISFSRGSSRPGDQTGVSCIAGGFFTAWVTIWSKKLDYLRTSTVWTHYFVQNGFSTHSAHWYTNKMKCHLPTSDAWYSE